MTRLGERRSKRRAGTGGERGGPEDPVPVRRAEPGRPRASTRWAASGATATTRSATPRARPTRTSVSRPTTYDELNRLTQTVDPLGYVTTFDYDKRGNLLRTTRGLSLTDASKVAVTRHAYDELDRLIATLSAEGYLSSTTYDAAGYQTALTEFDNRFAPNADGTAPIDRQRPEPRHAGELRPQRQPAAPRPARSASSRATSTTASAIAPRRSRPTARPRRAAARSATTTANRIEETDDAGRHRHAHRARRRRQRDRRLRGLRHRRRARDALRVRRQQPGHEGDRCAA